MRLSPKGVLAQLGLAQTRARGAEENPLFPYIPNLWTFDTWAHSVFQTTTQERVPLLQETNVDLQGCSLIAYDKRHQAISMANQIVHFYISDDRFRAVLADPAFAVDDLSRFRAVIGPDVSPYATHTPEMRASAIWYSKAISQYWQYRGLCIIPNVRWIGEGDLRHAISGLPVESMLAVSTLGVTKSKQQSSIFRNGLITLVGATRPNSLIVHGRDRSDLFDPIRDKTSLVFFPTQIDTAYANWRNLNG